MTATAKKKCFVSERKVTPYGQSKGFVRYPLKICGDLRLPYDPCADPENFLRGGGGGGKFPEGVLWKISIWQKLIIWQLLPGVCVCVWGGGERYQVGGGRGSDPCHPLWIRPCDRLADSYRNVDKRQIQKSYDAHMNCRHIRHSPRLPTMSKRS